MTPAKLRIARHMLEDGNTVTEIATTIGVGRGTLYRHLGDQALTGASARGGSRCR
jgi:transposase-like protein